MTETLKLKKKKGKMMVNPSLLIENKKNKEVYTNKDEENRVRRGIADTYLERTAEGKVPNHQPILIWEDGLVDAGNTRRAAGIIAGCDVWVEYSDAKYPDFEKTPYDAIVQIESTNIYRKMTPSVKLNSFQQTNAAYVTQFGMARTRSEEDIHLKKLGIARTTMSKLVEIKKLKPELLEQIDRTEISITAAYDEATGKHKTKIIKSNNPNRDWSSIYTNEVFKTTMNRLYNTIHSMLDSSVKINGEDYFTFKGFPKGAIAGILSHSMEGIGAEVLRSEGHEVRHNTGHPTDPDIYHIDIDDKVEIKVTNFNGASTSWSGGNAIREGQYILLAYDESIQRFLLIFTYLDSDDWKKAGLGQHTLPLKKLYNNRKDTMEVVYGDVYMNGENLVPQLNTLD
jgi:hypothetical protein|tara:strand:- start:1189 stop:2379 length:1191 start_codon:yes stop_codon:yes gene_type:complete